MLLTTNLSYSSNITATKVVWLGWGTRLDRLVQRCYSLTGLLPPTATWLVEDIIVAFNTGNKPELSDRTIWQLEMANESSTLSSNGFNAGDGLYAASVIEELMEEELEYLIRIFQREPEIRRVEIFRWAGMEPLLRVHKCVKEPYYHSGHIGTSLR